MLSKSFVFRDAFSCSNRVIILNHVGVLSTNRKDQASVSRMLNGLSEQENFNVILVSPWSRQELDESLGKECPKLILAAENGIFFKLPGEGGKTTAGQWEELLPTGDISWHDAVIGIMQSYQDKTDGAQVIERD